jgi:hypothetical protein
MFAAPRSSARRTHAVLERLVAAHGGVACWIGLDGDRLYCFDRVGTDAAAEPGFGAGQIHDLASVGITAALRQRSRGFTSETDGRRTLLAPVRGRRGHELGLVGLTLPAGAVLPDAEAVIRLVQATLAVEREAA